MMKSRIKIAESFYEITLPLFLKEFINNLHKDYLNELPRFYKLQYKDADDDLITICNQDDYDIALSDLKTLSVYLTITEVDGKESTSTIIAPKDKIKVTEPNKQPILNNTEDTKDNIEEIKDNKEEIKVNKREDGDKKEEDKKSIEQLKGNKEEVEEHKEELKDDKEKVEESKEECFMCKGRGIDKGKQCKLCEGIGEVDAGVGALKDSLEKTLREEMIKKVQEEIKRNELDQLNPYNSLMSTLSQLKIISTQIICSLCKKEIEEGESFFYCLFCDNLNLCKRCENEEEHIHTLLKGKVAESKVIYRAEVIKGSTFNNKVKARSNYNKTWTFKNTGTVNWPQDTKLVRIGGDELNFNASHIGNTKPGVVAIVTLLFFAPKDPGKYRAVYRLKGDEKLFGPKLVLEFEVEDEESSDPLVRNTKRATANMELVKQDIRFKKEYEDTLMNIFLLGDWEPKSVLNLVIQCNNNISNVIEHLFDSR